MLSEETAIITTVKAKPEDYKRSNPSLTLVSGGAHGHSYSLSQGPVLLGRVSSCPFRILDDSISRYHTRLFVDDNRVTVEDLGSTNGTLINGCRLSTKKILQDRDVIHLGHNVQFFFSYLSPFEARYQLEIYHHANFDPLTQTRTKTHFYDQFEREFLMTRRSKRPLSLIAIDVDFFKQINDSYGHNVGDTVLAFIADFVRENIRADDLFARYGGEEFLILLRETDEFETVAIADRLRNDMAAIPFECGNEMFHVTISGGVSSFNGSNFESPKEMFLAADKYLYSAKASGRNCVQSSISCDQELEKSLPLAAQRNFAPVVKPRLEGLNKSSIIR